ncbi:MAG: polysaccharide biosynthesis/export family protein, partial [Deltaproteobacteria bacterium]|nr:polysaccharide biosynthesis/export family protein [Deltaproteobacteria bacterium]
MAFAANGQGPSDLERLALLWQKRTHDTSFSDYPIGPGDVLEISVPGMDELQKYTVRVSGEGTVALPLIGEMRANGLTEKEISEEIRRALEEHYMYN